MNEYMEKATSVYDSDKDNDESGTGVEVRKQNENVLDYLEIYVNKTRRILKDVNLLTDDFQIFIELSDAMRILRKMSKLFKDYNFFDNEFDKFREQLDNFCFQYDSIMRLIADKYSLEIDNSTNISDASIEITCTKSKKANQDQLVVQRKIGSNCEPVLNKNMTLVCSCDSDCRCLNCPVRKKLTIEEFEFEQLARTKKPMHEIKLTTPNKTQTS